MNAQKYLKSHFLFLFAVLLLISCSNVNNVALHNYSLTQKNPIFEIIFYDYGGVYSLNTKTKEKTNLLPLNNYDIQGKNSPNEKYLVLTYSFSDSVRLSIINLETYERKDIITLPQDLKIEANCYFISFEWSPDSKFLLYGNYKEDRKSLTLYDGNIIKYDMVTESNKTINCKVSKTVIAYIDSNYVIVGNHKNSYLVDVNNCNTVFTFGKHLNKGLCLHISPNSKLILYKKKQGVYLYDINVGINKQIKIPYIDINLLNNISWISDNSIVFDYDNSICTIDFSSNNEFKYIFKSFSESQINYYDSFYPAVSPNKQKIAFYQKRTARFRGQYPVAEFIFYAHDLIISNNAIAIFNETFVGPYIPEFIWDQHFWIDNEHIAIHIMDSNELNIYSIIDGYKNNNDKYLKHLKDDTNERLVASITTPNIPFLIRKIN